MPDQTDVVICEPLRTPIGRFGGAFAQQTPAALAARVIAEVVARTGVDPDRVDEVILGHAYPSSEAPAIGRVAALDAGLPDTVTGVQTLSLTPVSRPTGAAAPACRPSSTRPCRSGQASATSSSRAASTS